MRSFRLAATVGGAALLLTPVAGAAQVAWDGPMLMAPGAPAGWGFHLVDPHPGDGVGALVTWRGRPAPLGLGLRVGLFDGSEGDLALVGGVDVSGTIHRGDRDVPLDVIWFAGAGLGLEDDVLLSFPAGISAGWALFVDDVVFRPYLAPRIVLDAYLGNRRGERDAADLRVALELGLDLAFDPRWSVRAAASVGDRDALSIGFTLTPGSRE